MAKHRIKPYVLLAFLCYLPECCFALSVADSLKNKPYSFYQNRLDRDNLTVPEAQQYIKAWLDRAKKDRNYTQQAEAFQNMIAFALPQQRLSYADSALTAAKHTKSGPLIGSAYLSRGILFYKKRDYNAALDDYIAAAAYIEKISDDYQKHKISFGIAQIKYALGYHDEAVALFLKCATFFRNQDELPYLRSMHGLGLAYIALGDFEKAAKANREGLQLAKETGDHQLVDYFIQSDGLNAYYGKRYRESLEKLKAVLPAFQKKNDFVTESVTHYYIGSNYWALGKKDSAVTHFKQVDAIFRKENFIRPDLSKAYDLLIAYYESIGDDQTARVYERQYNAAYRMMEGTYSYLLKKLLRDYETIGKDQKHNDVQKRTVTIAVVVVTLLVGVIGVMRWNTRQRHKSNGKIKAPASEHPEIKNHNPKSLEESYNKIPAELVAGIRQRLDKFVTTEAFLNKDMTRPSLAKYLKSNPTYVGTVIQYDIHKTCNDFINDLRINYIVTKLQTDPRYLGYSLDGLASEAGFKSTKGFNKSFRRNLHMSPSEFLKQLRLSNQ